MKIYIAALFARRKEMENWANALKEHGHEITARWVYGGENGLTRTDIAILDLDDVNACDVLLAFTHPYGTQTPGGGRHVELGYALAKGKTVCIIGERENVFHHHPHVHVFSTLREWMRHYEPISE